MTDPTQPLFHDDHERTRVMDTDLETPGETTDSWKHPVNTGHLVMGVAFAGLLAVWALLMTDTVANSDIRWLTPLPWVVAGAVGLVAATQSNLRKRKRREGST
ncbi:hypothetical protein [Nocardioides alcanivorans]|uniref:hypothetical protein n=1 Tax=Nocardioides alcanivorans TaxID=2897352 RepID=UPI001F1F7307|nr:hypothetical protein [Nocardioides alcanivorans]